MEVWFDTVTPFEQLTFYTNFSETIATDGTYLSI